MTDGESPDHSSDVPDSAVETNDAPPRRGRESKDARLRREQRESDAFWKQVFASPVGRREIWAIIASADGAHAFETRFLSGAVGFPDANASWYARGEQDVGLRLYHRCLKRDPQAVALMHRENDPRFAKPRQRKAAAPSDDETGE